MKLQAYRIADKFLRLKKSEVLDLKKGGSVTQENVSMAYTSGEKFTDFLYFNDFYLISAVIIFCLVYLIFSSAL